ncbi:methyl-accepting chemotaxis protein [Paenibacillus sp. P25]|nr:methyl-accepting chemotaxis protein [Paenibacillus sp. P25]
MRILTKAAGAATYRSLIRTTGWTLRRKLILGLSVMMALFLIVAVYSLYEVGIIKSELKQQNEKVELKLMALELKELVQELNIIASGLEISKKTEYIPKYNEKRKVYDQLIKRVGDTVQTEEQAGWRSKLILLTNDYTSTFDTAAKLIQDNNLQPKDLDSNMEYLYNESQRLMGELFGYVDQFYVSYAQDADAAVAVTQNKLDSTVRMMIAAMILTAVCGTTVAFLLIRSFTGPLRTLQEAVKRMAGGDLSHTIGSDRTDELGELSRSFDHMTGEFRRSLQQTQSIASSLSEHSHSFREFSGATAAANQDIVRAFQDISAGAEQQARHSEHSAGLISDLEERLQNIAEFTAVMQGQSREAAMKTQNGSASMEALRTASRQSQDVLGKVYEAMDGLSRGSDQIGKIVTAITEISAQTGVLSLNASIEAARAGEHGKGFSVIAEEVRRLAAQTNESSKTIGRMVTGLQEQMKELDSALGDARESFVRQNGKVEESLEAFKEIRDSMDVLSGYMDQIHERIAEAKTRNGSLVESVQFVAAIAEETAAGVQEVHASSQEQDVAIRQIASESEEILNLALRLFEQIRRFRIEESQEEPDPAQLEPTMLNPGAPEEGEQLPA